MPLAAAIAVIRLALLWAGVILMEEYGDWRQIAGYLAVIPNSVVELAIASALTGNRRWGLWLTSGLVALTSAGLGWLLDRRGRRSSA